MPIKKGQWWVYAGTYERFRGIPHMVVEAITNEVSAWSDPRHHFEQADVGHSWRGTPQQFLQTFRPIEGQLQTA